MSKAESSSELVAFMGEHIVARGDLVRVASVCKEKIDAGTTERIAIFNDVTGKAVDIDFSGNLEDVLRRIIAGMVAPSEARKVGRPKLGVIAREVSLLPRHWEWLASQGGSASAALRRLVDDARKGGDGSQENRLAIDAAHQFIWDLAGDSPAFEEVTRALFAGDFDTVDKLSTSWPADIRAQLLRFLSRAS